MVHVLGHTTNIKEMKWRDVVQILGHTTNIKEMKRVYVVHVLGLTTNIKDMKCGCGSGSRTHDQYKRIEWGDVVHVS